MGKSFNIVRVNTPDFHSSEFQALMNDGERSRRLLGDQADFGWALPSAFRALANPLAPAAFPKKPDARKDFFGAIAYWHSLQWLLIYRLGWSLPGKGLMEIYSALEWLGGEQGLDGDLGDTLQLVTEVWFADGFLEHYIWWASTVQGSYLARRPNWEQGSRMFDQREHTQTFLKRTPSGMHLEPGGAHYFGELWAEEMTQGEFTPRGEQQGLLHFESAWGWYDSLCDFAERNPELELDVYVKSFGFMGTYKYSKETGLCYTGDHKIHLMGN